MTKRQELLNSLHNRKIEEELDAFQDLILMHVSAEDSIVAENLMRRYGFSEERKEDIRDGGNILAADYLQSAVNSAHISPFMGKK